LYSDSFVKAVPFFLRLLFEKFPTDYAQLPIQVIKRPDPAAILNEKIICQIVNADLEFMDNLHSGGFFPNA
jgi:hypothetical protein